MTEDERQRAFIEANEGRKNKMYRCTGGFRTIGVGHNCDAGPLPEDMADYMKANGCITDEMIDRLFETDLRHARLDCQVLFPEFNSFTEDRRIALTDFVFQLGFKRAQRFIHSIAAINTGRWEDAALQMADSLWATEQTPKRAARVLEMLV